MIGKKAAIGIIAATGVVAVGVPVGIVVGQHASKHESLDSKMTNKWSDIERELASSFGGFDVRNAQNFKENTDIRNEKQQVITSTKLTIDKIVGTSNDKEPFFNNFNQVEKNITTGVEAFRDHINQITDLYSKYLFEIKDGKIAAKQGKFTPVIAEQNGKVILKSISVVSGNTSSWTAPFEIELKITTATDGKQVVTSSISTAAFEAFAYEGNLSSGVQKGQSPLGKFRSLIKEMSRTSNQYRLSDLVAKLKDLINPNFGTENLQYFINGRKGTTGDVDQNSFAKLFGLLDFLGSGNPDDISPEDAGKWDGFTDLATNYPKLVGDLNLQTQYLDYSIKGHHKKDLVDAAIMNSVTGKEFDGEGFSFAGLDISPIVDAKVLGQIYRDKNNDFVYGQTAAATGMTAGYFSEDDLKSNLFGASNQSIKTYNDDIKNAAAGRHTFTNAERFQWYLESGQMFDKDGNKRSGEVLETLAPLYRDAKMNFQSTKEWFDQNEFTLVWDQNRFNSILQKYNLSLGETDFSINIQNENSNPYKLSISSNGQLYLQGDKAQTSLFTKTVTDEKLADYPLASPEWYAKNYLVAYSQTSASSDVYRFEAHAPFTLGNYSEITFTLKIRGNEAGKEYSNNDANRKPLVFGLNQDGELFVNNEGARA